jgi:hypothetical protein
MGSFINPLTWIDAAWALWETHERHQDSKRAQLGQRRPAAPVPLDYEYTAPQTEPSAITALALAVVGLAFCPIVSVVALVTASSAKRRIDYSYGSLTGLNYVRIARITASISLVLTALFILLSALLLGLAAGSGEVNPPY